MVMTGNSSSWTAWLESISYKPGWSFDWHSGGGFSGPMVRIRARTTDARHGMPTTIDHAFAWPWRPFSAPSAELANAWLWECILKVERHEAGEFLTIAGQCPFMPAHGPGSDPYA